MGWGTYYKHEGYLSRIGKDRLWSEKEDLERVNKMLWEEILAYMAATPPAFDNDREGESIPYPEVITLKMREIREEIESNCYMLARINDCIDAMEENPDNVTEG